VILSSFGFATRRSKVLTIVKDQRPKQMNHHSTELHKYSCINFRGGRHSATRWKVAGSSPDKVIELYQLTKSFQTLLASNRNEYRKEKKIFLRSRTRPVLMADKLSRIVRRLSRQCGIPKISQNFCISGTHTGIASI
jgi:hypothetical protein